MTYEIRLTVPDRGPIVETGEVSDPLTLMKTRLARLLLQHGIDPGATLTITVTRPPEE